MKINNKKPLFTCGNHFECAAQEEGRILLLPMFGEGQH